MGSTVLMLAICLLAIFMITTVSLNNYQNAMVASTYDYVEYVEARNIAHGAVNLELKNLENGGSFSLSDSLAGGRFSVSGTAIGDTVQLTATGWYGDVSHRIRATFHRYPKPFPDGHGALGINVDSVNFHINSGGPSILVDGRNYDSTGTTLVGSGDVPGINVLAPVDSVAVAAFGSKITGAGGQDVSVDSNLADPATFVQEYIATADSTFTPASPLTGNRVWGTATAPKIIYVDGGPDSNNQVRIGGTVTGWGILVVKGNVAFSGNFTWHGLVVAYSNTALDFSTSSGNPTFIGSVLMGGLTGASLELKGTPRFKYSSDALRQAKYINKLLGYSVSSWYEEHQHVGQ